MEDESDITLIARAIRHPEAYRDLLNRYQERLIHSLLHLTGSQEEACDVAQQAFLQAWQKLASFRGDSAFYTWLYRIAVNIIRSDNRRRRVSTISLDAMPSSDGFVADSISGTSDPSRPLDRDEQIQAVRMALQQIPEEFRQPLILKEIDGMSYEQIHEVLGIPVGTVRSRIFRARQELTTRLRRILRED